MSLLSLVLVGLAGLLVLAWLAYLTLQVASLVRQIENLPARLPSDRVSADRLQAQLSELQDMARMHRRDMDSFERRLVEQSELRGHQSERPSYELASRSDIPEASIEPSNGKAVPDAELLVSEQARREQETASHFNNMALSSDIKSRDEFLRAHDPRPVRYDAGAFFEDENGNFWMIIHPGGSMASIVPSGKVARDWEKLYRAMNGMQARETLGDVFDLSPGGQLKIESVATAERISHGYALRGKGRITGV